MNSAQLDLVFTALADPTQRALGGSLTEEDASVAQLAEPSAQNQTAISQHLTALEGSGLFCRTRIATAQYSHLEAQPFTETTGSMEGYKRFWAAKFDE
jgi:hypothetical protein